MIDEILSYDSEFTKLLPQLANFKRPIDILSEDPELEQRWIEIELMHARKRYFWRKFLLSNGFGPLLFSVWTHYCRQKRVGLLLQTEFVLISWS